MFHVRLLITALQGLRQNLLRSLLATLGVIIGVGAVVAAVSILEGTQPFWIQSAEQLVEFLGSFDPYSPDLFRYTLSGESYDLPRNFGIPEPSTTLLLMTGLVPMAMRRRRAA